MAVIMGREGDGNGGHWREEDPVWDEDGKVAANKEEALGREKDGDCGCQGGRFKRRGRC